MKYSESAVILKAFDYHYYRAVTYYASQTGDTSPRFSGIILIAILQTLSFFAFVMIPAVRWLHPGYTNKLWGALPMAVALIFNLHRYYKKRPYSLLRQRWDNEENHVKRSRRLMIILYWLVVLTVLVLEAIYL